MADNTSMKMTAEEMRLAREWVAKHTGQVIADEHVCQLVEAHYDGGLEGFVNSCQVDFMVDH